MMQAHALQEEKRDLQQRLAQERHSAAAATADLQRQLKAARDRVESMVGVPAGWASGQEVGWEGAGQVKQGRAGGHPWVCGG